MRNLREELLKVKGGDFISWHNSLTPQEKQEYKLIMKDLGKNVKSNK